MDAAKIRLSAEERELVSNAHWILTKNRIIEKAKTLLGETAPLLQSLFSRYNAVLPPEVLAVSPKISKGENYQGLPYLILDYPRYFTSTDIFALRTMFWWGRSFILTLHLSGKYQMQLAAAIQHSYEELKHNQFHMAVTADPWQHAVTEETYMALDAMRAETFCKSVTDTSFLKLALTFPLAQWDQLPGLVHDRALVLLEAIKNKG